MLTDSLKKEMPNKTAVRHLLSFYFKFFSAIFVVVVVDDFWCIAFCYSRKSIPYPITSESKNYQKIYIYILLLSNTERVKIRLLCASAEVATMYAASFTYSPRYLMYVLYI